MTTHYQKIQALGNRMAENLTIMGVPSQFEEGGLTLADKILEISGRVTSGIILYADKKIAQSEDTVNLYALVLDDNIAVSGEIVRFNGDVPLRSKVLTNTTDNVVGDDYYIHSTQPTTNWDFIGDLSINSEKIKIISETFVISEYTYVGMPHIKNGVLTFEDTLGETHTIDVSYTDTTSILTGSYTCTVYYPWVEITTDDDGVATYAYTCTGSGLREFYATSGTFVSETLSVYDCLKYEDDASAITNTIFSKGNGSDNASLTRENGYTNFSEIVTGTDCNLYVKIYNQCAIEFDMQQISTNYARQWGALGQSANAQTRVSFFSSSGKQDGNWHHFKIIFDNGTGSVSIDNETPTPLTVTGYDSSSDMYFRFITGNEITGIHFKGFKVYSI